MLFLAQQVLEGAIHSYHIEEDDEDEYETENEVDGGDDDMEEEKDEDDAHCILPFKWLYSSTKSLDVERAYSS